MGGGIDDVGLGRKLGGRRSRAPALGHLYVILLYYCTEIWLYYYTAASKDVLCR